MEIHKFEFILQVYPVSVQLYLGAINKLSRCLKVAQPSFSVTVHVYTLFKQEIQRCLKQSTKNYPIMWSTMYILEFPKRSVSSTYSYIYGNII